MTVEMATVAYGRDGESRMYCKCGVEPWYLLCAHDGTSSLTGPCLSCLACGRVYSADGVVLTRIEVRS